MDTHGDDDNSFTLLGEDDPVACALQHASNAQQHAPRAPSPGDAAAGAAASPGKHARLDSGSGGPGGDRPPLLQVSARGTIQDRRTRAKVYAGMRGGRSA